MKSTNSQFESSKATPFFHGYQLLNDQVNGSCSDLINNFPHLWIVIEKVMRVSLSNYDPEYLIPSKKKLFAAYIYQQYYFLLSYFLGSSRYEKFIVALPRFQHLEDELNASLIKARYCVMKSFSPSFFNVYTIFQSNAIYLGLLGMPVLDYKSIIRILAKKQNCFNDKEKQLLAKADSIVHKHILRLKKHFSNQKIKGILGCGSSGFSSATLCAVSRSLSINYTVLAHGFIGNQRLLTIAPIRSTYLVVWTKSQLEEMKQSLDKSEVNKLIYIGFPGPKILAYQGGEKCKILIPLIPLFKIHEGKQTLIALNYLINHLEPHFECSIRAHPKDYYNNNIQALLDALHLKPNALSSKTLHQDLSESFAVISPGSSVLVEAHANNIKAYQLSEGPIGNFAGIPTLCVQDVLKDVLDGGHISNSSNDTDFLIDNMDKFVRLLCDNTPRK